MHDPDGPTPKPPSTWGNTAGAALHNVYYRTSHPRRFSAVCLGVLILILRNAGFRQPADSLDQIAPKGKQPGNER